MPDLSVKRTTVLGQRRGIEGDGFLNAPQVYVSGVVLSYPENCERRPNLDLLSFLTAFPRLYVSLAPAQQQVAASSEHDDASRYGGDYSGQGDGAKAAVIFARTWLAG